MNMELAMWREKVVRGFRCSFNVPAPITWRPYFIYYDRKERKYLLKDHSRPKISFSSPVLKSTPTPALYSYYDDFHTRTVFLSFQQSCLRSLNLTRDKSVEPSPMVRAPPVQTQPLLVQSTIQTTTNIIEHPPRAPLASWTRTLLNRNSRNYTKIKNEWWTISNSLDDRLSPTMNWTWQGFLGMNELQKGDHKRCCLWQMVWEERTQGTILRYERMNSSDWIIHSIVVYFSFFSPPKLFDCAFASAAAEKCSE